MTHNIIASIAQDSILGVQYDLCRCNAKELALELKRVLKRKDINYNDYNSQYGKENNWYRASKTDDKNPPKEIYEYQNFFVMRNTDGELVLLDGFRRLLWYNAPDIDILVRIYDQQGLTDQQVLTLLVDLNHFKFFNAGGNYYRDRGFALLLRTVFGLDIYKYPDAFDGYLIKSNINKTHSHEYTQNENVIIKNRIVDKHFVDDMNFLEQLTASGNAMVNTFLGTLLFKYRNDYPDFIFKADHFLQLHAANKVVGPLLDKYKKEGNNNGAISTKIVNNIMGIYNNLFLLMVGGETEKSYAEVVADCKAVSEKINKDKNYCKLTGNKIIYTLEKIIDERIENNQPVNIKYIIYPRVDERDLKDGFKMTAGLREDRLELETVTKVLDTRRNANKQQLIQFSFEEGGHTFIITHNFNGKRFTKAVCNTVSSHQVSYDIEMFVDIPKQELKDRESARFPNRAK